MIGLLGLFGLNPNPNPSTVVQPYLSPSYHRCVLTMISRNLTSETTLGEEKRIVTIVFNF
jgi:hypothetical protein